MRKKTYEEIKHYIEEENDKGCKLETSKEDYINTHQKLNLRCKCGTPFSVSFHEIISKNKLQCNECGFKVSGEKQKMDGAFVYNFYIERDLIPQFKPEDYKNAKIKLPYICSHHLGVVQYISYDNLKHNKGCKYCIIDKNRSVREQGYKKIVEDKGYIYVGTIYKNKVTYYQYKCPKHLEYGVQEISSSNFKDEGCVLCGREKQGLNRRVKIDVIKNVFKNRDYEYYEGNDYQGNTSPLKYKCNKHPELGWQETTYANIKRAKTCIKCIYEGISGENHYLWKGGISPLHNYLRYKINDWKRDSLKQYNFCCGITGIQSNNLVVHHMYGFNLILDEVLFELNLDIRKEINLYSDKELLLIENLLVKKHYEYGLGIPLLPYIHDIYHKVYGRGNNTQEEFNEFKIDYLNGKYNYLKEVG